MKVLLGILMFLSIWAPVIVAAGITRDSETKASRQLLLAGGAVLVTELVLLYVLGRGISPVRALFGAFRGNTTYQSVSDWCLAVLLSLPAAVGIGCAARYFASGSHTRAWVPVSRRTKAALTLLSVCAAIPLILGVFFGMEGAACLRMTEVCREQTVLGEDKDMSYLILQNTGRMPCDTEGVQLVSDSEDGVYALPPKVIAPGDTAVFQTPKAQFVDIRKGGGSTIRLLSAGGTELDAVTLPEMPDDTAWRLTETGWRSFPLLASADDEMADVPAPAFSALGGFYDEAFSLELSAPEGCEICYTLDGSVPTADSERYTAPIRVYDRSAEPNRFRAIQNVQTDYLNKDPVGQEPVDKAFVVRAVAVDADGAVSAVATQTYLVGLADYAQSRVIALTADPEELFGDDGIYVTGKAYDAWYADHSSPQDSAGGGPTPNFMQRGEDWERAANLEMYTDGARVLNQPVGLRIQGNSSRTQPLKRFSIYARKLYGGSRIFDVPIFEGVETHSMALRSGFDNELSNALLQGRDVGVLRSMPVTVFLNGEFWYQSSLTEKISATYFSETFGVAKDDVECVEIGVWSQVSADDKRVYREMLSAVESQGGTDEEQYRAVDRIIDLQSYLDFICANLYLGNTDCSETQNVCVWRTGVNEFTPYGDGRWRWVLKDMDLNHGIAKKFNGYSTSAEINTFTDRAGEGSSWPNLLQDSRIWETLKDNAVFRRQFVLTFMDLVNTTFAPERVSALLEALGRDLSYDDDFYRVRAGYITRFMEDAMGLSGTQETITVTADMPEAGTVTLNTVELNLTDGGWSGVYYTDYPVTLTAVPAKGHTFVGWEINGERVDGATVEVEVLKGGSTVNAIFE